MAVWSFPQKVGVYSMVQRLAGFKTSSQEEQIVYGKIAIFFNDWETSAKLSSPVDSPEYRNALFVLLADIGTTRSEAINDKAGVQNIDYLIDRIKASYGDSIRRYFGDSLGK
ncbi:hypothetical protein GGI07_002938 [Coemansia sp. Benny D115]|nr:hypothetical protein GGI07_002938 [Coemansia sp. Benny D115]